MEFEPIFMERLGYEPDDFIKTIQEICYDIRLENFEGLII